jgi:uncharacterized membrane protein
MEADLTSGPTWATVALAMVNGVQVVILAYIGWQQARSSRERIRRAAHDEQRPVERHRSTDTALDRPSAD